MTSVYTMLKDLVEFCERNNVKLNHANEIVNGEYSISLTWKPTEHDGSVCRKLPLDDIEDTVIKHVPKQEPVVDKMPTAEPVNEITVTTGSPCVETGSSSDYKEEVKAWNKLGKKDSVDAPDDDGEIPIKKDELKGGERVVYYGGDASRKGMPCTVVKVTNHGYTNTVAFDDNCIYNQVSLTQLRRKVNGA